MKTILFVLVFLSASSAMGVTSNDSGYYTITSTEVQQLEDSVASVDPIGSCASSDLTTQDLDLGTIINVGKQVWDIIQAGKPVLDMQTDVASALPKGKACWNDLQGWHTPQTKSYQVSFKNAFGMTVVSLSYRVMWMAGGNVNGTGRYIAYATVFPDNISVMWGFKLNASVNVPVIVNTGTKSQPVAGMQLQIRYQIESPLQTINQAQAYFVDGNGTITTVDQTELQP